MACLTVGQAGRAPAGRRPPPWPVGPRAANGVTFLVPQELNASRPATPKMDSAMMTVCAGNGGAPQRQLVAGTGWGGQGRILGSCDAGRKSKGPPDCSKQRPRPHRKPTSGGRGPGWLGMAGGGHGVTSSCLLSQRWGAGRRASCRVRPRQATAAKGSSSPGSLEPLSPAPGLISSLS